MNYILPLITLPYLVRVLGPDKFGLITFATSFITYFQLITDYGFNLTATREVSINRENEQKLSMIFISVMTTKFILIIISVIILIVIISCLPEFKKEFMVYLLTFGIVIGNFLFPVWFFQGMENMKIITILNIAAKIFFTVAIFIFVRNLSDYMLVPLLNSFSYIFVGALSLWIIKRDFNLKFYLPSVNDIKNQFKSGWHVFLSTAATSLNTTSNVFILGLFTNNTIVSYYSVAEKIVTATTGLIYPLSQTVFPHITRLVNRSQEEGLIFIKKITKIIFIIGAITSILLLIFAELIINTLFGSQYGPATVVLRILAFLPLIIGLSHVFGVQTMLTFNYNKAYSSIIITMGILNVGMSLLLVPLYQQVGTSISLLVSQLCITLSMYIYLRKKGLVLNLKK